MDLRDEDKKKRLSAALENGVAMVHLDARRPGVIVPAELKDDPHLRLNLSYRFDPPDLTVGEWGVRATLSFSGRRFLVALPWSSIFAVSRNDTEELWLYPDEVPGELLAKVAPKTPVERGKATGPRALLREVATPQDPPSPPEDAPDPPRVKGHLRLVK